MSVPEGLSDPQLKVLQELADKEIADRQATQDRRQFESRCPGPTYQEMVKGLAVQGVTIQEQIHCWLRFRRHNYPWGAYFGTGTMASGATYKMCINCSHRKGVGLIGARARMMPY